MFSGRLFSRKKSLVIYKTNLSLQTKSYDELRKPEIGANEYNGTLRDFLNSLFIYFNWSFDLYIVLNNIPSNMKFSDGVFSQEIINKNFFDTLPPKDFIKRRFEIEDSGPIINYTFRLTYCIFIVFCNICDSSISKLQAKVIPDENLITYDNGKTYLNALKEKRMWLAGWTKDGWLLCRNCLRKNMMYKEFKIERSFDFEGDLPRGRSKYRKEDGSYDKTRPCLFRK